MDGLSAFAGYWIGLVERAKTGLDDRLIDLTVYIARAQVSGVMARWRTILD